MPLLKVRRLNSILGAYEVQIEHRGASIEVLALLLQALRTALLDAGEAQTAPALRELDAFGRKEQQRWEAIKAGTLPSLLTLPEYRADSLIQAGYKLYQERRVSDACDRWIEAWALIKQLVTPKMRTFQAFEAAFPIMHMSLEQWIHDLEMELGNSGLDKPLYHERRLQFTHDVIILFSNEAPQLHASMLRAQGEALWCLGRQSDAEAVFSSLVRRFPDDAWGYIGWADQYWFYQDRSKDYAQAEQVLRQALTRPSSICGRATTELPHGDEAA